MDALGSAFFLGKGVCDGHMCIRYALMLRYAEEIAGSAGSVGLTE